MSLGVLERHDDVVSVSGAIRGTIILGDRGIPDLLAIQFQSPTGIRRGIATPSTNDEPHADLSALYNRLLTRNTGRPHAPRTGHPLSGELDPL
jgi:hypothetical protein